MDRLDEINFQMKNLREERENIVKGRCAQGDKMGGRIPNAVEYDGPQVTSSLRTLSDRERIHNLFCYHPPEQHHYPKFNAINQAFENAALIVNENVGSFKDREQIIEGLSQLRMISNRGIVLEDKV